MPTRKWSQQSRLEAGRPYPLGATWDGTGTNFALSPGQEPEGGIVAGLGLNVESQFLNIKVGYDTEISDNATTHYGSITLRLAFW